MLTEIEPYAIAQFHDLAESKRLLWFGNRDGIDFAIAQQKMLEENNGIAILSFQVFWTEDDLREQYRHLVYHLRNQNVSYEARNFMFSNGYKVMIFHPKRNGYQR